MSDSKTILIPSFALNYVHNRLESVGVGGELYKRDSERVNFAERVRFGNELADLKAENSQLRRQLADVTESMGRIEKRCAQYQKLVELMSRPHDYYTTQKVIALKRELGIEVG